MNRIKVNLLLILLALLLSVSAFGESFYEDGFGYTEPVDVPEAMLARGFIKQDYALWQAGVYVHSRELWLSGVTRSPTAFYLELTQSEIDAAAALGGKRVKDRPKKLYYTGVWIAKGGVEYALMTNAKGAVGYFENTSLYDEAGKYDDSKLGAYYRDKALWRSVMEKAETITGEVAAPLSLTGLVSATLEWPSGEMGFDDFYDGRGMLSQTITDKESLKRLKELFKEKDPAAAGSNCPYGAFLTLRTADATRVVPLASDGCASCAVAGRLLFGYGGHPWGILKIFDEIGAARTAWLKESAPDEQNALLVGYVSTYVRQYLDMIGRQALADDTVGFVGNDAKEADDLIAQAQIEHNARQTRLLYEVASFETSVDSLQVFGDEIHIELKADCVLAYPALDPSELPCALTHYFVVQKTDAGYVLKRHYEAGDIFYAYTGIGAGRLFDEETGRVADIPIDLAYVRRAMAEDAAA